MEWTERLWAVLQVAAPFLAFYCVFMFLSGFAVEKSPSLPKKPAPNDAAADLTTK